MSMANAQVEQDDDEIDLSKILAALRRWWVYLLLGLLAGAALGVAYVITTTPVYTSSVNISLDTPEAATARENAGLRTNSLDEEQISTEMEVIQSEAIAEKVVDELDLDENELFLRSPQTGASRVIGFVTRQVGAVKGLLESSTGELPEITPSAADQAAAAKEKAVNRLRGKMQVTRVERSRILSVSYTALSPGLAARVANTIADIYIQDQLESTFEATERATEWLRERAEQLREQSNRLDNRVEQFRRENGLLNVSGENQSDKELERISQRLSNARADLVELVAKRDRLQEIVEKGDTTAAVSATATQSITTELRSRFLETLNRYENLKGRLGEDHEQTRQLKRELDQIQSLLFEEIKRSAEVAANEVEVARERVEKLETAQSEAEARVGADSGVMVELRKLERNAETVRDLYSNFQQRYQESLQQQNFQVSEARILNPAKPPGGPSSPQAARIVVLFSLLGLMSVGGYVGVREGLDDRLRTEDDVRDAVGMEYIGGLATLSARKSLLGELFSKRTRTGDREVTFPEIMRYAADSPLSPYSEALRAAKMAVSLRHMDDDLTRFAVGVVSCLPGEGKTTTAANFANLLANQGNKVMLIDGDLRNPGLTRGLKGDVEKGLVDILAEGADWREIHSTNSDLGTDVLPSRSTQVFHTSELLGGRPMRELLQSLRQHYDFVVLDLPPLAPVVDARAVLELLDGVIFIAQWGKTRRSQLRTILRGDQRFLQKSYGMVFNMFEAKKARYYGSKDAAYYGYAYSRYYKSD
jgi:succinoglycan biosynthesis transport protein ExoP